MDLSRRYRFGKNRGKVGNGLKRKMLRKKRHSGVNTTRYYKQGIYTSLLDNLLAEPIHIKGEKPEFVISLRNKPLIGKVVEAQVVVSYKEVTHKYGREFLDKLQDEYATLEHINRETAKLTKELGLLETEAEKDLKKDELAKYEEEREKIIKKIATLSRLYRPYANHQRSYIKAKVKNIRLRVTATSYDRDTASYSCLTEPFIFKMRGIN